MRLMREPSSTGRTAWCAWRGEVAALCMDSVFLALCMLSIPPVLKSHHMRVAPAAAAAAVTRFNVMCIHRQIAVRIPRVMPNAVGGCMMLVILVMLVLRVVAVVVLVLVLVLLLPLLLIMRLLLVPMPSMSWGRLGLRSCLKDLSRVVLRSLARWCGARCLQLSTAFDRMDGILHRSIPGSSLRF